MKRVLHRVFLKIYELGYLFWVKIGKVMYWDGLMLEGSIWDDE